MAGKEPGNRGNLKDQLAADVGEIQRLALERAAQKKADDADQGSLSASLSLPRNTPIHIYAVITDARGAMTQITTTALTIVEEEPVGGWLLH